MIHVHRVHAAPTLSCTFCKNVFERRIDLNEHEIVHDPATLNSFPLNILRLVGAVLDSGICLYDPLLDVLETWDPGGFGGLLLLDVLGLADPVPGHCSHLPAELALVWDPGGLQGVTVHDVLRLVRLRDVRQLKLALYLQLLGVMQHSDIMCLQIKLRIQASLCKSNE